MTHDPSRSTIYSILAILETLTNLMFFFFQSSLCFPNTDYLVSRAEAALGSIDKVKKGHADYLSNMGGKFALVLIQHDPVNMTNCSLTVCSCNQMLEGC